MEGVQTHPEACLLHSPLKWVDEDENVSLSEHNQNYSLIASEINNHLLNEDKLNGNYNRKASDTEMVNDTVNVPELPDSTSDSTPEKQESRSECWYCVCTINPNVGKLANSNLCCR